MTEEVALAAADLREAVDPGQKPGGLENGDRDGDGRARTFRSSGDALVGRKAAPAAIGPVEAPQQRSEDPQARPGQRSLVLPPFSMLNAIRTFWVTYLRTSPMFCCCMMYGL